MRRLLVLALLVAASRARAQDARAAARAYREGRYAAAAEAYETLIVQHGAAPPLVFDHGDALYRLGRYGDAAQSFEGVIASSPALAERAWYNLGAAYLRAADTAQDRHGTLLRALDAFEHALVREPGDRDAKWNLEVTLRRVVADEQAHNPGPTSHADWGRGNLTKSGYSGQQVANTAPGGGAGNGARGLAAPKLSKEEARRLLKAFQEEQLRSGRRPQRSDTAGMGGRREW